MQVSSRCPQIAHSPTPAPPASSSYNYPRLTEIYQGIYSDGSPNYQISINYPEVQELLQNARVELKLPENKPRLLLAVAAIAVWDRPTDPVHWIFWGTEDKIKESKDLVTSMTGTWIFFVPTRWLSPRPLLLLLQQSNRP
jgi:hypothetical protein